MKKIIILIACLIVIIVLIAIGVNISKNKQAEEKLSTAKELYLVYLTSSGFFKDKNVFQLYNENGELVKETKLAGNQLNASYVNKDTIYFGGFGGLYEYNKDTLNIEKSADDNISIIKFYDNEIYYYVQNEEKICHGDECINVDMYVGDFVLKDDYLYVLGNKLKIYQNNELVEEYDYDDESLIIKMFNLNDSLLIINEFNILKINGKEVKKLKNIKTDEIYLYYEDENQDNYIFDIDDQILMYVDLKDDNTYNIIEKVDITRIYQDSYDFTTNQDTYFIINGYNKLILTDTAGKTLKEINLDVNSRDAIYGAYRLK